MLTRETEDASDGIDTGTYLGLGLEPTVLLAPTPLGRPRVWFPLELGLSLADYYQDPEGREDRFGYGSVGAFVAVPLPFLPGSAALEAGARHAWFGDHAGDHNGEERALIGSLGLALSF